MSGPIHPDATREPLAVETRALAKRYRRDTALDGVDLRVPEGAVYVLVGPNGAGKSSMLKVLMNLETPTAGTAEVFGMDTVGDGPRVRAQIGYVPENSDRAYDWMTCGRLLSHLAAFHPTWDADYAARLADAFGVRLDRKAGALSKGQSRSLHLLMALAHRPPLLLLDEPTDGLDPVARRKALTVLAEHLADTQTTVVVSTHHMHEVESLADHVGVLHGGRLAAQMPREEMRRTVLRYRVETPPGWEPPPALRVAGRRGAAAGREAAWTIVGEEREVARALAQSGASVREVTTLGLEDATLAFLPEEAAR